MKFLIHIPQLIYGGAEKVLVNFANCLVENGHYVEILETYEKGYLKPQFDKKVVFNAICSNAYTNKYYSSLNDIKSEKNILIKISKCFKLVFSKIVGYRRFAEKLCSKYYSDKKFDVAINYLEIESTDFILNNIKANKYMQWIHTDVSMYPRESFDKFYDGYLKMNNIICVSNTAKESFCKLYSQLSEKVSVIYNFFDVEDIIKKSKESIDFENEHFTLLSVGRLIEAKAYPRAIKVVKKLVDQGYNFKWYIIGEGADRPKIEELIEKYNLQEIVILLGIKDNPYPYIKKCDLFFLPSLYEGFPTVTIEAKILNKPVLATEVSGIREQIVDGKHGIVAHNDEESIYTSLKYLLDNQALVQQLSDNSDMERVLNNNTKYEKFLNL